MATAQERIGTVIRRLGALSRRLASNRRGNVVMMFAFAMPMLLMLTLGGIDISRITTVKARMQDALDAATLAAARSSYTDVADLKRVALTTLNANLRNADVEPFKDSDFQIVLTEDQVVISNLQVRVKTLVANIVLPPYGKLLDDFIPISVRSEVNRSSKDIEVAMVLDITGSMGGSRIASLKDAARQLTTIVVQDQQQPYYSRLAVVPYSTGVNLGSLAATARGAPIQFTSITRVDWSTGDAKSITDATRANPGYITASNHGFKNGDYVWIKDVVGMTQLNGKAYRVANASSNSFSLQSWNGSSWQNVNTSSYSNYSRNGTATECLLSDCTVVVTAPNHGLAATDPATGAQSSIRITDVGGMSQLNTTSSTSYWPIFNVTANTFSLNVVGPTASPYTSGGRVWCGYDGCQWRIYANTSGATKVYPISDCVSERTGPHAYDDVSPSTALVGRYYANAGGSNAKCTVSPLLPLTDDRNAINQLIGPANNSRQGLQADGYTAAQIGLAWGWYAVSPSFNALWRQFPAAEYNPRKTLKAVILMTDGEFNAPYCSGVLASNASFGGSDRAACPAPNGEPYGQSRALCEAIKNKDIILYTVGFQVSANSTAGRFLRDCATSPSNFFLPASGADLTESFKAIGRDITRLRISR
ncbi:ubiquitin-activating E1 FCCH domain-containing protein [Brevundimonas sp. SORGH_AS_0993]|uniref:ubiquitin-activating E1 FCCH domain-containing protein n=1 Tax=Brevundimonas sp. SORGH_AS_0993 TaxID=3041794 RepID=UPI00278507DE|nr:ubiquitin-activating E1 FCCH domain-containing protein [Brevundimonas sp. SORGH_AS_0993]MDQ1154823.1 Flp pilus assembly protein TadG [Brevundimonas sp. SORGH_AS_0993]